MQTLTEIVAAVVIHSSAVAYSHFGVPMEAHQIEKPAPAERTVARTAAKPVVPVADCPQTRGKTPKAQRMAAADSALPVDSRVG